MSKEVMSFEKFKYIMETLQSYEAQKDRINDFFEQELATDSWFLLTLGNDLLDTIIDMLADEFECWFSYHEGKEDKPKWWSEEPCGYDNDISYWLYPMDDNAPKEITVNGETIDITSIRSFYDYLVSQLK